MAGDYVQIRLEETPTPQGQSTVATPFRQSSDVFWVPASSFRMQPDPAMMSRADEIRNIEGSVADLADTYAPSGALSMRGYPNLLPILLALAGWQGTPTAGGASTLSPDTAIVNGSTTSGSTSILVDPGMARDFPASGSLKTGAQTITYTGHTDDTFTGIPASGGGSITTTIADNAVIRGLVPTGVTLWEFTKRSALLAQTARITEAYGDEGMFLRGQGWGVSQLGLSSEGVLSADLVGMVLERIADPTLTPALEASAIIPFRRRDLHVTWLTGGGPIGDFSWQITNPLERVFQFTGSPFADRLEYGNEKVGLTVSIPKRVIDPDDYDAAINGATFAAKARYKSDHVVAATDYPYGLWIDAPAMQYTAVTPDDLSNARRFGMNLDARATWDETAGYDAKISVACATPSIYTWA